MRDGGRGWWESNTTAHTPAQRNPVWLNSSAASFLIKIAALLCFLVVENNSPHNYTMARRKYQQDAWWRLCRQRGVFYSEESSRDSGCCRLITVCQSVWTRRAACEQRGEKTLWYLLKHTHFDAGNWNSSDSVGKNNLGVLLVVSETIQSMPDQRCRAGSKTSSLMYKFQILKWKWPAFHL